MIKIFVITFVVDSLKFEALPQWHNTEKHLHYKISDIMTRFINYSIKRRRHEMKALLDNKFNIEVVEAKLLSEYDEIKITYSRKQHPELNEYFKNRFMKKETMIYKDEMQECVILIDSASFTLGTIIAENKEDDDIEIEINEAIYGDAGKCVPFEERENFIKYQVYGTLSFKIV
jgi:hypothetical protein